MKYHNEWYSSNIMSLCVVGNHTLDELQDFVEKHFTSVIDKDVRLKDYSEDPMMDNNTLGHIVKYVPVKKSTMLSIKWPKLPSVKEFWEGSPLVYLGHLIGDEGKGSLLSYLIKQGLAVSLMAGSDNKLQDQIGGFYIDITLTEKGMEEKNMWEVVKHVFAAINKFQTEGVKEYYTRERQIVGDL